MEQFGSGAGTRSHTIEGARLAYVDLCEAAHLCETGEELPASLACKLGAPPGRWMVVAVRLSSDQPRLRRVELVQARIERA